MDALTSRASAFVATITLTIGSCSPPQVACPPTRVAETSTPPEPATPPANPFQLPKGSVFRTNPILRAKLKASPHSYFRAINTRFAQATCRRFSKVMRTLPSVNLHGDAHVEQIAVTGRGVGLSDFDDSVTGPPIIDLVRFGTSVALAAEQNGWKPESAVAVFLNGYATALRGPPDIETPVVLERLRQRFKPTPDEFFLNAEALMRQAVPATKQAELAAGWGRYVALMLDVHGDRTPDFFRVKRSGQPAGSGIGIGSATSKRILFRVEGPTDAADDDVILEAKEMRDISSIPCVNGQGGSAVRIIASATQFGARPDPFLAVVPRGSSESLDDPPWWIQSWSPQYAEINIGRSLATAADLDGVSRFAAATLAKGHTGFLPNPYDAQLRIIVRTMLAEHRSRIENAIRELAATVKQAYADF